MSLKFSDKKWGMLDKEEKRTRILEGIIAAIILIGLAIGASFLFKACSRSTKYNAEVESRSLDAIMEAYPDVESVESVSVNGSDRPAEIRSYVLLRKTSDGWKITKERFKPKRKDRSVPLVAGDVAALDVIVVAVSDYESATYQAVGAAAGERHVSSESVQLYYYNPGTNTVFCQDTIAGKDLPKVKKTGGDYTIKSSVIIGEAESELGVSNWFTRNYAYLILLFGGCLFMFLLYVLTQKRR